jgi:hypothetical protein
MSWGVATRNAVGLGLAGIVSLVSRAVQQAVAVVDPFFNYVTLLLPGNGTNGAQNNTFVDSSTNAFTITRNGNTTQGTFSPFSQTGWGNYFDGSGDYLTIADNAAFQVGSGAFTLEAWVYLTTTGTDIRIYSYQPASGTASVMNLYRLSTNVFALALRDSGGTGYTEYTTTSTVTANTWYHVAAARDASGNIAIWVNGTRENSTASSTQNVASGLPGIGGRAGGSQVITGYISNLRLVKGTDVYGASNTTITVPTAPLTAISGTSLLTCQSNRFIDNSSNAFAITVNGNTSIQAFSPFNPTAAWSAATNGGSGYFDGSGDYLTVPDDAFWDLSSSTGSIELFVYPAAAPSNTPGLIGQCPTTANWGSYVYSDKRIGVGIQGTSELAAAAGSLIVAAWNHIVITRDNSTSRTRLFVNGVLKATGTGTYFNNSSAALHIGYFNGYAFNGFISNVRFCNGSIPTTYQTSSTTIDASIFTPPSSPVTTSSQGATSGDTELLCNFTNAGIYDATSKNDLETVGNAQISTTQSQWGGSSMYFDGTGDYLTTINKNLLNFGSGDFTIECWFYKTGSQNMRVCGTFDAAANNSSASAGIYIASTGLPQGWIGVSSTLYYATASTETIPTNSWVHYALVRDGATLRQFVNGVEDGTVSVTTLTANSGSTNFSIGQDGLYASGNYQGYIQDFRITKGYARYTTAFTPPTAAFPLT